MTEINTCPLKEDDKIEEKVAKSYTRTESMYAFIIFLLSFGFVRFILYNTSGILSTAVAAGLLTAVTIFLKLSKIRITKFNYIILSSLYLFSIVYSITDNVFIKGLNTVFLIIGTGYLVYSVSNNKNNFERFLPFAIVKASAENPFANFFEEIGALNATVKSTKFGDNIKMIITGLVVTIPLTAVVGALLMSADSGVENMLNGIIKCIASESIWNIIWQTIIAVLLACYLFGMTYSGIHKEKITPVSDEECEKIISDAKLVQNMVVYSAVTPICILYVMFFISQANYFLSAFSGTLPQGYAYSGYARKGFFELFAVTLINFAVILIINLISKNSGKNKPLTLKIYNMALCFFTFIMIAVAMSKMIMYISVYGFTRLRFYTMWFMVLIALIFVVIAAREFCKKIQSAKWITSIFTVMFAILCFCRPDALITKCNIMMYESGILEEFDKSLIFSMSDDAVMTAFSNGMITKEEIIQNHNFGNDSHNLSSIYVKNNIL